MNTLAIIYGLGVTFTAWSFWYVNRKYYGHFSEKDTKKLRFLTALISVFWLIGLPVYMWHYRAAIKGVVQGRDWADDSGADEELKALMRMEEEDALAYLKNMEEEFVRQIDEVAAKAAQPTSNTNELLN